MKILDTKIPEVKIIEPDVFGDHRGWFMETWSEPKYAQFGFKPVQDNESFTAQKGTLRGIQWVSVELSAENKRQFYIPRGFGHGFVALTDDVNFCYKVDNLYSKECDRSIRFDDPAIGVEWGVSEPVLSDKDKNAPLLADSDCNFVYGKE